MEQLNRWGRTDQQEATIFHAIVTFDRTLDTYLRFPSVPLAKRAATEARTIARLAHEHKEHYSWYARRLTRDARTLASRQQSEGR